MTAGTNVIVKVVTTKTPGELRHPSWTLVEGKLVADIALGGSIFVARTHPYPAPYWQTSEVMEIKPVGKALEIKTRNSVYTVTEAA